MPWRTMSLMIAMLAFCANLMAADDPFLGAWELNLAKSKPTRGGVPKSQTVVNTPEGKGAFKSTRTQVNQEGKTLVEIWHFVFDGKDQPTEGNDPRAIAFKRVDANTIETATKRNGQVASTSRIVISKDGKTMTASGSGTSGQGEKYTNDVRVYDKK